MLVAVSDAILETTERLLETHSLDELRVADILSQARVSKAAFYGQYANKAAVVAALVRRGLEEAGPSADEALRANQGLDRDELSATVRGWLEQLWAHRALILAAIDGRAQHPELATIYKSAFARLRERIPADPPLAAALLATAESVLEGYLRGSPELTDAERVAQALSAIYLDIS